jgi:hypothetical protein
LQLTCVKDEGTILFVAATLTQAGKKRGYYHIPQRNGTKTEVIKKLLKGIPRSKAPGCAGVVRSTFYEWLEQDEQFAQEVEFAEAMASERHYDDLSKHVDKPYKIRGDTKTKMDFVRASFPEFRSSPETLINIGHLGNNNVVISDEKVEALRKLRDAATQRRANAKTIEAQATLSHALSTAMPKGSREIIVGKEIH